MWVNNLLKVSLLHVEKVAPPGFEPATHRSRYRQANHSANAPHKCLCLFAIIIVIVISLLRALSDSVANLGHRRPRTIPFDNSELLPVSERSYTGLWYNFRSQFQHSASVASGGWSIRQWRGAHMPRGWVIALCRFFVSEIVCFNLCSVRCHLSASTWPDLWFDHCYILKLNLLTAFMEFIRYEY